MLANNGVAMRGPFQRYSRKIHPQKSSVIIIKNETFIHTHMYWFYNPKF